MTQPDASDTTAPPGLAPRRRPDPDGSRSSPTLIGPDTETADLVAAASGRGAAAEVAWRVLLDRYGRRVFAMARSRCRSDDVAEDIAQSVFATVAGKLRGSPGGDGGSGYTEAGRFEPWLFRIAMNRVRDEMRRRGRRPGALDPAALAESAAIADTATPADPPDLAPLRRAMDRLGGEDRVVVELRHQGGLSFNQIAETLGKPLGTVLARHHRALKKLRAWIEDESDRQAPEGNET